MIRKYRRKEEEIEVLEYTGTESNKTEIVRYFNGDRDLFEFREFGSRLFLKRPGGDREVMKGDKITRNRSGTHYIVSDELLEEEFEEI